MAMDKTTKAILNTTAKSQGIDVGSRMTKKQIKNLETKGAIKIDYFTDDAQIFDEFIKIASDYAKTGKMTTLILNDSRYINPETQNQTIKDSANYHNIGSHSSLEKAITKTLDRLKHTDKVTAKKIIQSSAMQSFQKGSDRRMTKTLAQLIKIPPQNIALQIGGNENLQNSKMGYSFRTFENHTFAVTWLNLYKARKMLKDKTLQVELPKKMYARGLKTKVKNLEDNTEYDVTFRNIPSATKYNAARQELFWNVYFTSNSEDFDYKSMLHKKQEFPMLYATKHVVAAYIEGQKKFASEKFENGKKKIEMTWYGGPFLVPNNSFERIAEVALSALVVNPQTKELMPLNEVMINQYLDKVVQKYGANKLFTKM